MQIGYARTSTLEQVAGFDAQVSQLTELGCEKIFKEQVSSVAHREELGRAVDFAREGDVLIVTKLDRLARSITHLWKIIDALEEKGVGLRVLDLGIDTQSPTGKLVLTLLGGIAEFERDTMLSRQREGIARAKAAGKYKGRKPTARKQSAKVLELREARKSVKAITDELNISRASVYRILKAA